MMVLLVSAVFMSIALPFRPGQFHRFQ
jgi:hypothetical protein